MPPFILRRAFILTGCLALGLALVLTILQAASPKPSRPGRVAGPFGFPRTCGPKPSRPGASEGGPVSPSTGAFSREIPIAVPAFHGLEPELSLMYDSSAGNGFVGMGWSLSGQSFVERASPGQGAPGYDANDIFLLDGEELVGCTTFGGTYCMRHQDYRRIQRDMGDNKWYVWSKEGIKATYEPVYQTERGTFRWGLSTMQDTHGNMVEYKYWCERGQNCYPEFISYNKTTIQFWQEERPDDISFANGLTVGHTKYRLKTIDIKVDGQRMSAYVLSYRTDGNSARSTLSSVRQYGTDATVDDAGNVTLAVT